jgi:hypothetical protein
MSPFQPLDEQARWRTIYELLQDTPVNEVLTYASIGVKLGLHPMKDRHTIQVATRRAAKELLVNEKHALSSVINTGYRVVESHEHVTLARGHQRKSSKALVRAHETATHVEISDLNDNQRQVLTSVVVALGAQMDFNRRLDINQKRLAEAVTNIGKAHQSLAARTEDEVSEIKDRLERLERERQEREGE